MLITNATQYKNILQSLILRTDVTDDEMITVIRELVNNPNTVLSFHEAGNSFIVRTSLLKEGDECNHISRCSYPPDSIDIPLQRCNYKQQSAFYGTWQCVTTNFKNAQLPSLFETCMQKIMDEPSFDNRQAVVSFWRINRFLKVWALPFHPNSIEKNEDFKLFYNHFDKMLLTNFQDKDYDEMKEKLTYLSSLFCFRTDDELIKQKVYYLTATYFNEVSKYFDTIGHSIDGLLYPAGYTDGEAINIVLKKESIDEGAVNCVEAHQLEIFRKENDPTNINFKPIARAIPDEEGNLIFTPVYF